MLKITARETSDEVLLQLEGKLKGSWVLELEDCWRAVSSTLGGRHLTLDLTDVEITDTAGRYLLTLMHSKGATFVAFTPMMQNLVADITRDAAVL
jgi:anti-anti-sigma regulatory factor